MNGLNQLSSLGVEQSTSETERMYLDRKLRRYTSVHRPTRSS
jgi:hypothetical protein